MQQVYQTTLVSNQTTRRDFKGDRKSILSNIPVLPKRLIPSQDSH
ncbi:hypothetical protein HanXRQr2_Chr00c001g0832301 [Helianthus annuus]|uniref:Uncharacterized protein n=1 Tax=Helianthus annuus TaxID=4232 RepID=A0A9K3K0Z5_HELAN|nr:hypothetical protein HanXRQr2_Chr00c001g0832301 [Helianthus annuus]